VPCGTHSLYVPEQIGGLLGYSPRLHGTSAGNVKMLHGAGPRAGSASLRLVTLPPSLDAPSLEAEGAGCAKSRWDSDCLGGFSVAAPSRGLADVGSLPGPTAACNGEDNGEELSFQLPLCSLPSASLGTIPMDPTSPCRPLEACPMLNTLEGMGWVGELPLGWRGCLWSC